MDSCRLRFHRIRFDRGIVLRPSIRIDPSEVQIWGFILDLEDSELPRACSILSAEERARADRLVSEKHRRRAIAAHAWLRVLLSQYVPHRPQDLMVARTVNGKPFLPDAPHIRFNLAHSCDRALFAVGMDREVGVDLEMVRPEVDILKLAMRFLSARDQAFILGGMPWQRHERFLQVWVAREAVFKAAGTGLRFPLHHDHIEVSADGTTARVVRATGVGDHTVRTVRFLTLESGWIGALAADGADWTVRYCS